MESSERPPNVQWLPVPPGLRSRTGPVHLPLVQLVLCPLDVCESCFLKKQILFFTESKLFFSYFCIIFRWDFYLRSDHHLLVWKRNWAAALMTSLSQPQLLGCGLLSSTGFCTQNWLPKPWSSVPRSGWEELTDSKWYPSSL